MSQFRLALQDAMSRQAQAEREKEARVILGSAEAAIAAKFVEAARTYAGEPAALHLRAMNIIYETTKERGATILMPTSMVDSMSVALPAAMMQPGSFGVGKPSAIFRSFPRKRESSSSNKSIWVPAFAGTSGL